MSKDEDEDEDKEAGACWLHQTCNIFHHSSHNTLGNVDSLLPDAVFSY